MEEIENKKIKATQEVQALGQLKRKIESGEITINQARTECGLDPIKSGDTLLTKVESNMSE